MNKESIYKVCARNDSVYVQIKNKASYVNCAPLRSFLHEMFDEGKRTFVIDFQNCSSMDSTFLGILVGLALQLRKSKEGGSLSLLNLIGRNLETVKNLGIHKIAIVSSGVVSNLKELETLKVKSKDSKVSPEFIYKAHKHLLDLNEKNEKFFKDVVNFMEQKVEDSA